MTSLLGADFARRTRRRGLRRRGPTCSARLIDDLFAGSLPARLRYTDKNARRFGVAVRMPFVDRDLVRFVFGLGDDAIVKDGSDKRVLRDAMRGLLPDSVTDRRNKVGFTTPQGEWFMRLKNHIYGEFLSESFANRPYFDQTAVLHAFEGWIKGTNYVDSMTFWRMLNLELWLQEFFDERKPEAAGVDARQDRLRAERPQAARPRDAPTARPVRRYPLRTDLYAREDDLDAKTLGYIERFFAGLPEAGAEHAAATERALVLLHLREDRRDHAGPLLLHLGHQGRRARRGCSAATSPAPLPASASARPSRCSSRSRRPVCRACSSPPPAARSARCSASAGSSTTSSAATSAPSTVPPSTPSTRPTSRRSSGPRTPTTSRPASPRRSARGCPRPTGHVRRHVVMDANDIGRNVLGKDAPGPKERYEAMFADNPLGQGSEQTPMAIVFEMPSA